MFFNLYDFFFTMKELTYTMGPSMNITMKFNFSN